MGVVGAMGNYTPNRSKSSQGDKSTDRLPGGGAGVQARIDIKHGTTEAKGAGGKTRVHKARD